MTKEEKQLLLKDLCARLPYHPRINVCNDSWEGCQIGEFDTNLYSHHIDAFVCDRIEVKPYLRPMSSMTEEEKTEFREVIEIELKALEGEGGHNIANAASAAFEIDFYNAHHLDYRGLIEKGLAIDSTGLNIYQ